MPIKKLLLLLISSTPLWACGAGTYTAGTGKTYATLTAAYYQLWADCGVTAWNATNTIEVWPGTTAGENCACYQNLGTTTSFRLVINFRGGVMDGLGATVFAMDLGTKHVSITGQGQIKNYTNTAIYAETGSDDVIIAGTGDPTAGAGANGALEIGPNTGNGINSSFGNGAAISNVYAHDNSGGAGIVLASAGSCLAHHIKSNSNLTYGIAVFANNCTVHDSWVIDNSNNGGVAFVGAAITAGTGYNIFSKNSRYGLQGNTGATGLVFYNSLDIGSYAGGNCDNGAVCTYYNDTFVSESTWGIFYGASTPVGEISKNNTFYMSVSGSHALYGGSGVNFPTSDYNNVFVVGGSGAFIAQWGGINYSTLAAWKIASGTDTHSVSGDPLFSNSAGTTPPDFKWTTSSPNKNAGTTIGLFSTDYFGTSRPQGSAWDIGFYELIPLAASGGAMMGIQ